MKRNLPERIVFNVEQTTKDNQNFTLQKASPFSREKNNTEYSFLKYDLPGLFYTLENGLYAQNVFSFNLVDLYQGTFYHKFFSEY